MGLVPYTILLNHLSFCSAHILPPAHLTTLALDLSCFGSRAVASPTFFPFAGEILERSMTMELSASFLQLCSSTCTRYRRTRLVAMSKNKVVVLGDAHHNHSIILKLYVDKFSILKLINYFSVLGDSKQTKRGSLTTTAWGGGGGDDSSTLWCAAPKSSTFLTSPLTCLL